MMFLVFMGGLIFGIGLAVSGMSKPEVVLSFLQLKDFGLLLVMAGGILVAGLSFAFIPRIIKKPVSGDDFKEHSTTSTKRTILGAAVFGAGWGLAGICPGAALTSLGTGNIPILIGIAGIFIGAYLNGVLENYVS
jgi:hypothetical protein